MADDRRHPPVPGTAPLAAPPPPSADRAHHRASRATSAEPRRLPPTTPTHHPVRPGAATPPPPTGPAQRGPSLVQELGEHLRGIGAGLPLGELTRAATRLNDATSRCAQVMTESGHAEWVDQLTAAGTHLDSAITATLAALDGLDGYLTGIGLPGVPRDEVRRVVPTTARPRAGGAGQRPDAVLAVRVWWVDRVDLLTAHEPAAERPATERTGGDRPDGASPEDPAETLRRLVRVARGGGRDAYREALLRTHPASGLQLPAPATRVFRPLATDLLGHAPGPDDRRTLTERYAGRVRELLPRVPERLAADLVAEVCDPFGGRGGGRTTPHHPVDAAASWPVLVAELLRALGRDDAEVARLTALAEQRPDETLQRDGR